MELYKSKYSDGKTDGRDSRRENKSYRSFRNSRDDRGSRNSRDESTTVTCSDCGTECTIPFVPRTNKPVYCMIALDKTSHRIQEMIDIHEMTEVQDIHETTEAHEITEMTEAHILPPDENLVEIMLDLVNLEVINF